jgi:hypothetical protein
MWWIGHRVNAERDSGPGRHAGAYAGTDGHSHSPAHAHAHTYASAPAPGSGAASTGSGTAQSCSASSAARLQRPGRGQQGRRQ